MSPDAAEGCVGTRCPACGAGLAVTYLLSRWNPFRFLCPRCGAALAYGNTTKSILLGMAIGALAGCGAIWLDSEGVVTGHAAFVLSLAVGVGVALAWVASRHRRGRVAIRLADSSTAGSARNYGYGLGIALPAAVVLLGGLALVLASVVWTRRLDCAFYANLEGVADATGEAGMSQEESVAVIGRLARALRSQHRMEHSTIRLLFRLGTIIALLALWIQVGGWFATRSKAPHEASTGDESAPRPPPTA